MNTQRIVIQTALLCLLVLCLTTSPVLAGDLRQIPQVGHKTAVIETLHSMPLAFTQNVGQWPDSVLYRANAGRATMWFTSSGAYYQLTRSTGSSALLLPGGDNQNIAKDPAKVETMLIRAGFVGSNPAPRISGVDRLEYKCNYFLGSDQSKWQADVPNYQAMVYEDIYPGINLKYYGNGHQMEYDFQVSPGADYSKVQVKYEGARSIAVTGSGELVIETEFGSITERRPVVYQTDGGIRKELSGRYEVAEGNRFSFKLDNGYNPNLPLVIDPVLVYSTYLGGSSGTISGQDEKAYDIAVDLAGNAFITGITVSADFPTLNGYDNTLGSAQPDAFVTKLAPGGNALVYSTYLGGSGSDFGLGMKLDAAGNVYLSGATGSSDFPTVNAFDNTYNGGGYDVFVTKLAPDGDALIYSTYLGGTGAEYAAMDGGYEMGGITVDSVGSAYVTGITASPDFPTLNPYQNTFDGGNYDAFVTKLAPDGSTLVYSTYLSGGQADYTQGIEVDAAGSAYVTGSTRSSDFPTQNAYDNTFNGVVDAFITKFAPTGDALIYSTFLGGTSNDYGVGLTLDGTGNAYVTGLTYSSNFPQLNAYQSTKHGSPDAFVTKFAPGGNTLVYSTFLGGTLMTVTYGIKVDVAGNAYIAGGTTSPDYPTMNAYDNTYNGGTWDAIIAELTPGGNALVYSTFLGGSGVDFVPRIAIDAVGNVYVAGQTGSADFPTLNAYDNTLGGAADAFVAKLTAFVDPDGDGIESFLDNCPNVYNPGQEDLNHDGIGDACCCLALTGNVDCDPANGTDISDLTALIDNLYLSFTPLCCKGEANVDGSTDGGIDISDLTALIDYLYISFTLPAVCQ